MIKKLIKDTRGNTLVTVAFVMSILIFCMHYLLTWGMAVNSKNIVVTAARAYAVYNDAFIAQEVAKDIVQNTLSSHKPSFNVYIKLKIRHNNN